MTSLEKLVALGLPIKKNAPAKVVLAGPWNISVGQCGFIIEIFHEERVMSGPRGGGWEYATLHRPRWLSDQTFTAPWVNFDYEVSAALRCTVLLPLCAVELLELPA